MSSTRTQWILELVDKVTKPLRNITQFGNKAQRSISGVNRLLDRVNSRSQVLSRNLRRMSIAGLAFGVLSAGSLGFENSMARANTMAQVGTEQLSKYTDQIRDISEVVPKAKKQLAEGFFATVSAGVKKEDWMSFLKTSSKAAFGGKAEIGTVVDTTASIVKAYGVSWKTAIDIQDRLQKTVELGQIPSLEALGSALPRVTALSSKLNISQQELFSTFATASGVTGKPAEVATQLNAALSALLKPSSEAIEMAGKLKIAFDAKSITRAGGLQNYIEELIPTIQKYAKVHNQTEESIIGRLFGSQEAIKLVIGLGGKLSKSWRTNTDKIAHASGSVNKAFNIMAKTTQSQAILMKNSFSNALDGVVNVLAPFAIVVFKVIARIAQMVTGFMRAHPTISKFIIITTALIGTTLFVATGLALVSLRLDAMYLKLLRASLGSNVFTASIAKATLWSWNLVKSLVVTSMRLAGNAVGYALVGASMLGSFVVGLVSAAAAQWGLNIALTANPIGLIVIGIAAAVGAIVLMIKYWKQIKSVIWSFTKFMWKISPFKFLIDVVEKIFPGFKEKVKEVFSYVKNLVLGFWESIKKVWANIKSFFGFGDSTEMNVRISQDGEVVSKEILGIDPLVKDKNNLNSNALAFAKNGAGTDGSGSGSGKTISITLNMTNNFKVAKNVKESIDHIANEVVGRITDRLRDAEIALG